ncbi:MAG TPA: chemotaxis-specific protein-glutamate methyltransferase CheB [Thermoanaerobaculaceae bacterium]|nr:chemotaxis-specific protein-glutamate methyltransferase CheB [Thermoanaerobaculaceae bacterium]
MRSAPGIIGVLVVDDSPTVRAVLTRLIAAAPEMRVVGEAGDGAQAVDETVRLGPDVILMDIEMPVMDGFQATERIMALRPTPIVVVTSRANRSQVRTSFDAIRLGAVEVLPKPEDPAGWEVLAHTLPVAVRAAAQARAGRAVGAPPSGPNGAAAARSTPPPHPARIRYVAVGASTGGPWAVRTLLAALPNPAPASILVVQHIAPGFEEGLAEWLAGDLARDVRVARDGETAAPGAVRVAPQGAHLLLAPDGALRLDATRPARTVHRPSADELFLSCAASHAAVTAGVLLTGMGSDGAEGLAELRRAGGLTIVQDESSSVVFGMPRAALEAGAATIALPPAEIGALLARAWSGGGA